MKKPIIPIERASEAVIKALIDAEILEVTEDGIKTQHAVGSQWVYQ